MSSDSTQKTKLERIQQTIRLGLKYKSLFGRSRLWTTYKNYYRGIYPDASQYPVNIIYAIGRSLIPQLAFRLPRVGISPAKPGFAMHSILCQKLVNQVMRENNVKREVKSMILDAYLCGTAPGIFGYDSEFGCDITLGEELLGDNASVSSFSKKGEKIEYNSNISPGMPWFLRCSPFDFVVPWGTKAIETAPGFAFRKMRMLKDIKEDPKYNKKAKELKANFKSNFEYNGDSNTKSLYEDADAEWCELWQYHDVKEGKVYVVTLDQNLMLREDDDEMQIDGLPATTLGFNEDPDHFWWTPDVKQIEAQQKELNEIRTMARAHRKVALLKILYDADLIDKEELEKLLSGDPQVAVKAKSGPSGDIRRAVQLFQSHIPPDLAAAAREVREDVREIIGFSRNQMGSFEESSGRRTAHEAEIVRMASMIRIDERRDVVADLYVTIARKTLQAIFKFWNAKRVVDVVGPDGMRYWVAFSGPEIKGEFSYNVNAEETIPSNQLTKRQDAQTFMTLAARIPGVDQKYLLQSYASTFDWIDPQRLMPADGYGRNPAQPMDFRSFLAKSSEGRVASSFPELGE